MRFRSWSTAAALALAFALFSASARADSARLTLAVDPSARLSPESVRAAIADELGVDVVLVKDEASANLRIAKKNGLALTFDESPGGRHAERVLSRPTNDAVAIEMVALLAGNLVRDEAGDLVARLRRARAERLARDSASSASASKDNEAKEDDSKREDAKPEETKREEPKRDEAKRGEPTENTEPTKPAVAPKPTPADSRTACARGDRAIVGADFVPYVGSSSFAEHRERPRRFSFNVLAGWSEGMKGAEIGGLVNIDRSFACGVQIGGLANVVGGPVTGLQLGGIANVTPDDFEGVQIAGVTNVANDVRGLQLGPVNRARDVRGMQLGVINVSREVDVPIGVINVVTRGETHVDAWHDMGMTMGGLVHGGRIVHNIYGAGARLYGEEPRAAVALGIGARVYGQRVIVDVDAISQWLPGGRDLRMIGQLRAIVGIPIAGPLRLLLGPSANVETTDDPNETPNLPLAYTFGDRTSTRAVLWPGITVGLRGL